MVEYLHDQNANNITNQYNVTWSRTSPIIVSVGESAYETYMTLECDHSMGMTVVGTLENMKSFNFECSSSISLIEYAIMNSAYGNSSYGSYSANGAFGSVTMGLLYSYLNNNTESFMQNGFIIIKSVYDNSFLVIDPETGILRDINSANSFCGAYDVTYVLKYITSGIPGRSVTNKGEVIKIQFSTGDGFCWDGNGRVLLASSLSAISRCDPATDQIWADDQITITIDGTLSHTFADGSRVNPSSPIDITSICHEGFNNVQVNVVDIYGAYIGCSSLYLIQVISLNRPHDFESARDIWKQLQEGNIDFNDKKIVKVISGLMGMAGGFGTACAGIAIIGGSEGIITPVGVAVFGIGVGWMTENAYNLMMLSDEPWFISNSR